MTKQGKRNLILARLERALHGVYHNASLHSFYFNVDESPLLPVDSFVYHKADWEIEYLRERAKCTGEGELHKYKLKSGKFRAGHLIVDSDLLHGLDTSKVYSYGRGGATVAPAQWMRRYGCSDGVKRADDESFDNMGIPALTLLVQQVEAFNQYVRDVCDDFLYCYNEEVAELTATREDHLEPQAQD